MKFEEDNAIFDTPFGIIALFKDSDAKAVYQGRGVARGIKCDVWRQIRINWPGDAQAYTIWRWFFTEKEGEESLLVRILIIESCYFFIPRDTMRFYLLVGEWTNIRHPHFFDRGVSRASSKDYVTNYIAILNALPTL